jgi:aldehyde:ferredoxin oxidoreductase
MRLKGVVGKILRIDLLNNMVRTEDIPADWLYKYLGGRGLAARYYYEEVGSNVSSFSLENKLIVMTGPLTGTGVFGSTKAYIVSKSPLTGHYCVTNAGGYFGSNLKRAGYDGLIVEGRAEKPVYIYIVDSDVKIKKASHLWGLKTGDTQKAVYDEVGEKRASVACIGPAGERLSRIANVISDFSGRRGGAFGRGGIGAVMGSKNLKAIAVYGSMDVEVADQEKLFSFLKECTEDLKETTSNHTKYGTLQYTEALYELGAYPIMNFNKTNAGEGLMENLFANVFREKFFVKDVACFRCPVACGKLLEVKEGLWKGKQCKIEYETVWSFGPHCMIFDPSTIIVANCLADEYGLDGISAGYIVGFAMELYERGIIDKNDTEGLNLRFGNAEAEIELLTKIGNREGIGNVLAEGSVRAAETIGRNASYFAMHVKGMELTAYDPRAFYGMALTYATSSRGACHNVGGWTIRDELLKPRIDRFAVEGKGALVKSIQDVRGYIDSLGLCTIPRRALNLTDEPKTEIVKYVIGKDFSIDLLNVGERVYNLERIILNREGVSRSDDILPQRLMTEKIPDGLAKGRIITPEIFNRMLNEYYYVRGWSLNGYVTENTKNRLLIP